MADDAGAAGDAAGAVKPVRVFVSYSHDSPEHKARVLALADKLCADGIDCELDQYNNFPGKGWYRWSIKQLQKSDFVLLVCTETYCRRLAGEEEEGKGSGATLEGFISFLQLAERGMINDTFIPVVFRPEDHKHIPIEFRNYNTFCVPTVDGEDYEALYALLLGKNVCPKPRIGATRPIRLKPRPEFESNPASPTLQFRPWLVPHPENPFFTGRQDELDALHAALHGGGRAAICQAISGLGGIGKTQTAARYCHDHRDAYAAVFWLRAQSPDTLTADVQAVARELGLPEAGAGDQAVTIRAVQRWLCDNTGWLLVLDNVDTDAMRDACRDFLPTGLHGGAVLITSRLEDLTELNVVAPLRLPVLPEAKAVDFLLRRIGRQQPDQPESAAARLLARDLGCLPLALEQAAAYCKASRLTFQQYRTRFKEAGLALLEKGQVRAGGYEKTIATTWQLSIAEVARECPAAVTVLQVCSMLAAEGIPLEVIRQGGAAMGPDVAAAMEDGVAAVLIPLAKYSLIDWEVGADDFSMHRLVQCVTRADMAAEEKKARAEQAVAAVGAAYPHVELASWPLCERLTPHAFVCRDWMDAHEIQTEAAARLCNQAGCYLFERGRYAEAELFSRPALTIQEKVLGPDHPDVANSLNNLAALLASQGKPTEAESLHRRALAIWERVLEPDHPAVATSLNNLAGLLRVQGKLAEAEPLYRHSLAIREKVLGPDHPSLATSLNSLALLLEDQGKPAEAESLHRRALEIGEKVLGLDHPDVAISLNNLAELLRVQGKLGEAKLLQRRALGIRETVLGPEHPDVATSLNSLSLLLADLGKLAEAEPLQRRALEILEKVLGPEHPDVANSLNNLAGLLADQSKPAEAEPLQRRALAIQEQALGPDHPHVATCLHNLAHLLQSTNRADEAAPLLARAKAIRKAHAQRNNLPYDEDDE